MEEEKGLTAGTPAYLGHYQKATTQVVQNLSENEHKEMQGIADHWKNHGPTLEIKTEYVFMM